MSQLAQHALELLQAPLPQEDIIFSDLYRDTSLLEDIHCITDRTRPISTELVMNILVKYFHAYVHSGSYRRILSLKDITMVFDQFAHRRRGCKSLLEQRRLRQWLVQHSFALCMLADLPKTASIFAAIAGMHFPDSIDRQQYTGLDIGTGSGILLLAAFVQAKRNNFRKVNLVGIERDPYVQKRTARMCCTLEIGEIILGDAKTTDVYAPLRQKPVTFVANETIPGIRQELWCEDFVMINETMFRTLGPLLEETFFFPEGLLVMDRDRGVYTMLNKMNQYHQAPNLDLAAMSAQALLIDDRVVPLNKVGDEYLNSIPNKSRPLLTQRW